MPSGKECRCQLVEQTVAFPVFALQWLPRPSQRRLLPQSRSRRRSIRQGVISHARQEFRGSDIDIDGTVSQADARIQDETWPTGVWRPLLEELARYDLDFDGIVTRDEILMGVSRRIRRHAYIFPSGGDSEESLERRIEQDVVRLARADRNGDGRIEWDEMLAFARQTPVPPNSVGGSIMSTILSMDENRDGSATGEEFR
jgi:hypothetical protein